MSRSPGGVGLSRPVATPLPLSFLALALGSVSFAAVELGWVPAAQAQVAAVVAVSVTAPLQMLAAVLAFGSGDAGAGTGAALLSGSWAVVGVVTLITPSGHVSAGLGIYLVVASVMLVVPVTASWPQTWVTAVMSASALRFALTGLYELTSSTFWHDAAGVVGVGLAALAWCAGLVCERAAARTASSR